MTSWSFLSCIFKVNNTPIVNNYKTLASYLSKVCIPLHMEKIKDDSSMSASDYSMFLVFVLFAGVAIYVFYKVMF